MIDVKVPGSKSITNRALLIAALANGKTVLLDALESEDTVYMQRALKQLGVRMQVSREKGSSNSQITIFGTGKLRETKKSIYCGNAGTAMRFLTAVLATQRFTSTLDGNVRMRQRPIRDLADALEQIGVTVSTKNDCPPIAVTGPVEQKICTIRGDVSSQFLSGLLIAAPLIKKDFTIHIDGKLTSKPYVDMTIQVMKDFGVDVQQKNYRSFFIKKNQKYNAIRKYVIEPDASSLSYFAGIELLTGEKFSMKVLPSNLQADTKFLDVIQRMRPKNYRASDPLLPLGVMDCSDFPDAAMTLAVLCAFAKGKSQLTGLSNLRVKESDRLTALRTELRKIGCKVDEHGDGLTIHGDPEKLHGAAIHTYDDHRMAMCFGMASAVLPGVKIQNPNCVKKTYPTFWKDLEKVRANLQQKNIVLIGMRGTGKSQVGKVLAKKMNRRFIDLDREIERSAGMKIAKIVEKKGWNSFRKLESSVAKKISKGSGLMISAGGGIVTRNTNTINLKQNGVLVLLDCSVNVLKERLQNSASRPSLTGKNFLSELDTVYRERKPLYLAAADEVVDVSLQTKNPLKDLKIKADKIQAKIASHGIFPNR